MSEIKSLNLNRMHKSGSVKKGDFEEERHSKQSNNRGLIWIVLVILLAVVGFWIYHFFSPQQNQTSLLHTVFGQKDTLKESNGRVNVLLLGISGGNHDGPNLTDTIMVASYDTQNGKLDLISLPRDIWIDQYQVKLNAVYEIGLSQGNGLSLAETEVGKILGIDIPYAVRVDFSGFVKAVDLVGGLDINVANSFEDNLYPIAGSENDMCGYQEEQRQLSDEQAKPLGLTAGDYLVLLDPNGQIATTSAKDQNFITYNDQQTATYFACRFDHLVFTKGLTHMDGETALKYVRSRHGNNGEGSDFARARRQQQVIETFKEKVLSLPTLTDPSKMVGLINTFGQSFETDIPSSHYLDLVQMAKKNNQVSNFVIDSSGTHPLLVTPPAANYHGAWVLIPAGGDYTQIHQYVDHVLNGAALSSDSAQPQPTGVFDQP
ncbi:LCP family protein [Patescibacteria group bacterium]|nr:LCP family protein [Patescibacteria group bacterium]MCL5410062.1 LCP family protein [Patescibacteria group bacterium]